MLLVKETINYSCRSEDRILESELIAGLRDSLKRKNKIIVPLRLDFNKLKKNISRC